MHNSFESLVENSESPNFQIFSPEQSQVENGSFDITEGGPQPIQPVNPIPGELPPFGPQWGKAVNQRLTALDGRLTKLERDVAGIKTDTAGINAKLDQLTSRLK